MAKARDAFRTISEVSEVLDTPAHVLRFWESKFSQVKPVKRAGGRRYYRPEDVTLLGGIKTLLHDQGMTIKAVQALLRSEGVKHVQSLSAPLSEIETGDVVEHRSAAGASESVNAGPIDNVVPLQTRHRDAAPSAAEAAPVDTDSGDAPVPAPEAATDDHDTSDTIGGLGTAMPPPTPITPATVDPTPAPPAEMQETPATGASVSGAPVSEDPVSEAAATKVPVSKTIPTAMPPPTDIPAGPVARADAATEADNHAPRKPKAQTLPDLIETEPEAADPRFFDTWKAVNEAHVISQAKRIEPLVQRLEALRDRMRRAS